jgi:aminoglycoside 6-adenylyltransferase
MLTWKLGFEKGFNFSIGKDYKYLQKHILESDWAQLLRTWRMDGPDQTRDSLITCLNLFHRITAEMAPKFSFLVPDYDQAIRKYVISILKSNELQSSINISSQTLEHKG